MDATDLQSQLLSKHGICIAPEMNAYLLRKLQELKTESNEIHVIGGDARTGVPQRIVISRNQLISSLPANP